MPNLLSFSTCCVDLELRPLPSTGITRLPRYYGPLRHPKAPGLSLTGIQLVIANHAMGLPVLRAFPLCTCCRQYPGAVTGIVICSNSSSHISFPRMENRVSLHIVLFEACSAFIRITACTLAPSPYIVTVSPKASASSLPPNCFGSFRPEQLPGGSLTHWNNTALARRTSIPDPRHWNIGFYIK